MADDAFIPPPAPPCNKLPYILFFDSGSTALSKYNRDVIEYAIGELSRPECYRSHLVVSGYTDRTGSKKDNLILSKKRAEAVKAYFIMNSVPPEMIKIEFFGEQKNRLETRDSISEKENRRVEVRIVADPESESN